MGMGMGFEAGSVVVHPHSHTDAGGLGRLGLEASADGVRAVEDQRVALSSRGCTGSGGSADRVGARCWADTITTSPTGDGGAVWIAFVFGRLGTPSRRHYGYGRAELDPGRSVNRRDERCRRSSRRHESVAASNGARPGSRIGGVLIAAGE